MERFDNRHMSEDQILGAIDTTINEYIKMSIDLKNGTNFDAIKKYSYWLFKYSGLVKIEFEAVEDEDENSEDDPYN